ncbi:MAG: alpha/beta fold hydrolase [Ilumatobacteraceae bacterium]
MRRLVVLLFAAGAVAACSSVEGPNAVESRQGSSPSDDTSTDDTSVITDETGDTTTDATDVTTSGSEPSEESLTWGECDPDDVSEPTTELPGVVPLECSTLEVPLDYDEPDGEQIELALIRQPASGEREGAILTNPGGPGGSGFEFIANAASTISQELGTAERFDMVGFDPRGVDRSGGVDCVDDGFLDAHIYPDLTPDNPHERQVLDESEAGIYAACRQQYGPELVHYSTENTARDMDAIRQALGDDQISFLGISYGTYLGGVYATLFPDRVRAMVLDSAFEPTNDTIEQQYTTQLEGFEGAFDNWTEWCADAPTCAFTADDAEAISDRWMELFEQLDQNPLTGPDDRLVNQSTMFMATIAAMYSEVSWPDLAASLADA